MRHSHKMSIGAGGFVLLGIASVIFLVTQIGNRRGPLTTHAMYDVTANFDNIGDLKVGAHVSMSGVEIGRVKSIDFDAVEQKAVVSMRLNTDFDRIPNDSSASIYTQGVLGGKFVSVTNGGSEVYLKNNDRIPYTHSATSLETVISQLLTHYLKAKSGPAADADRPPNRP
jgi:phospholipid/cholesterol/gamma-HCH transport system substrate-binding protein